MTSRSLLLPGIFLCCITLQSSPGSTLEKFYSFPPASTTHLTGRSGGLMKGIDGAFYGLANQSGDPVIYRVDQTGQITIQAKVAALSEAFVYGLDPRSVLLQSADGTFYGSFQIADNQTRLFKVDSQGVYSPLGTVDAKNVYLAWGPDGNLYNTFTGSLSSGIFRLTPAGEMTPLVTFNSATGVSPTGPLLLAQDGNFYGANTYGGSAGYGTIYKLTSSGALSVVADLPFDGYSLRRPSSPLVQTPDGKIYGTLSDDTKSYLVRLEDDGTVTNAHDFTQDSYWTLTNGVLRVGSDGAIYGSSYFGTGFPGGSILYRYSPADGYSVFSKFSSLSTGAQASSIVEAADGTFFGNCSVGGSKNSGTLFHTVPAQDTLVNIANFYGYSRSQNLQDLVSLDDGSFVGVGRFGGNELVGIIYKLRPDGSFTVLHEFDTNVPGEAMTRDSAGNVYGVVTGGVNGTKAIFKIDPSGVYSTIVTDPGNLILPDQVIVGPDNNLYGPKANGKTSILKVTLAGEVSTLARLTTPLRADPVSLIAGNDGLLYGATTGGTLSNVSIAGSVFSVTLDGKVSVLTQFKNTAYYGYPRSIVQTPAGKIYGVVASGSTNTDTRVFRLNGDGTTSLLDDPAAAAETPFLRLKAAPDGSVYGTRVNASNNGSGAIFKIDGEDHLKLIASLDTGVMPKWLAFGAGGQIYGTVNDSPSVPTSGGFVFRISSSPSPFEQWLGARGATPADDEQGRAYLAEYATGGPSAIASQPPIVREGDSWKAVFPRRKDRLASGIGYQIQTSSDLKKWFDETGIPTVTGENGDYESISFPIAPYRSYARLKITSP